MENEKKTLASEIIKNQQKQIVDITQAVNDLLKIMPKEDLEELKQKLLLKKEKPVIKTFISHIDKELEKRQQENGE